MKTQFYLWRKLHIALDQNIIKNAELTEYENMLTKEHGERILSNFLKWADKIG